MLCRWRRVPVVLRTITRSIHGSAHSASSLLSRTPTVVSTPTSTPAANAPASPPPVSGITLRPYQEACIKACTDALAEGSTRLGVSLPTGAGKTTVFISLLSRIPAPAHNKKATQALIIVNTIELARQSADQVKRMFPEWEVEIEQGQKNHASGDADVTIATYQTLKGDRLAKFDRSMFKAVIVDEAHHAASPSYRRLLAHFNSGISHTTSLALEPPHDKIPVIGFSATFSRHDGLALGSVFERIVYHRDFLDMIREEWLCDVRFTSVKAKLDLGRVTTKGIYGDFVISSLAKFVNTPEINSLVVRAWMDRAGERKSTIVFCVDVGHVKDLTREFRSVGVDARYLYAETPALERKELIRAFKNGEYPVLVNCSILTEGADIPNIDCVVIARPTRSRNLFAQMIGRGLRNSPSTGKTDCRIIDFVDNHDRVAGLITLPTIFGLDPRHIDDLWDMEDATSEALVKRIAEINELVEASQPTHTPVSVHYEDFDNAAELQESLSPSDPMTIDSPFVWVNCGDNIHVLDMLWSGYVRVEPAGMHDGQMIFKACFCSTRMARNNNTFSLRPLWIVDPKQKATLNQACKTVDTYVKLVALRSHELQAKLMPHARWRRFPASIAQKKQIEKRWMNDEYLSTKIPTLAKMTKGEAHAEMTRIKHGYIGRAKAKVKKGVQAAKQEAKYAAAEARHKVEVGVLQTW